MAYQDVPGSSRTHCTLALKLVISSRTPGIPNKDLGTRSVRKAILGRVKLDLNAFHSKFYVRWTQFERKTQLVMENEDLHFLPLSGDVYDF